MLTFQRVLDEEGKEADEEVRVVRTNIAFATPPGLRLFCCVLLFQMREVEEWAERRVCTNAGFAPPTGLMLFCCVLLFQMREVEEWAARRVRTNTAFATPAV